MTQLTKTELRKLQKQIKKMQDEVRTPQNTIRKPRKVKHSFSCWDSRLWMYDQSFNDPHQSPFALD